MLCPKCRFDNREGIKFCEECGAKLELTCSTCGAKVPLGRRFCGECGRNLILPSKLPPKELSFDEKLEKIMRYLPKGLSEKILSQRSKIEGERKQVTVMFCDMEGFTPLAAQLGPEETYSVMDQVYEILIRKVHNYGGTVNELTGDGIMGLFGAPIALEDAPQRAIRSAMSIHREMARLNDKMNREGKRFPPLSLRVGIHSGPVVVGTLGNDLRVEFKAVGDTVNLASRIQGLAESGTTFVSEDTFKLTEGFFRFEGIGAREIKGKKECVNVYRVIAPSTRRTRFDVNAERGLTPFVGRQRELDMLLEGLERAKMGRGQAFSVMGEAGIGKSRLLYEFRKAVTNQDVTFLEGKCLSYGRGVPYHPLIDVLKGSFDIREQDGDHEIREKLEKGLDLLHVDPASSLPYLLELLSIEDSGLAPHALSPEGKKERIKETLIRILLSASERRPQVLAIEDLHWADRNSEEASRDLLAGISGARVLFILTYRPEFTPTWGSKSYHNQITLSRLSNPQSLTMARHLLNASDLDTNLEELILEKTEGVPFFLEEFLRSFEDLNVLEKKDGTCHLAGDMMNLEVPSTIHDVIMARVDALPEGAKEVLQAGSAVEREFSYALIRRIMGLPEPEILSRLAVLKDSELVYERGIYPESVYVFKHALTREVVYDSILTQRKKSLHQSIGYALEELHRNNLSEHYAPLTDHFIKAGNYEKGAAYAKPAAKKAEKCGSIMDAVRYQVNLVVSIERLPDTDANIRKLIDARATLGLYWTQVVQYHNAKAAVDPIVETAVRTAYNRRLAQIYVVIGAYYLWCHMDIPKANDYLEKALSLSVDSNDTISRVLANFFLGYMFLSDCQFEAALRHLERALDINIATNTLWGISHVKSHIASVYCWRGDVATAYNISQEALRLARESGDIESKAVANGRHGMFCYARGVFEEARESLIEGIEMCDRANISGEWRQSALLYLVLVHLSLGDLNAAQGCLDKMILQPDDVFSKDARLVAETLLSGHKGHVDEKALTEYTHANRPKLYDGLMSRIMGEALFLARRHELSEAERWIRKAIKADETNGMRWHLAMDYAAMAELLERNGDAPGAEKYLQRAVEIFQECGADGWVKKYESELSPPS